MTCFWQVITELTKSEEAQRRAHLNKKRFNSNDNTATYCNEQGSNTCSIEVLFLQMPWKNYECKKARNSDCQITQARTLRELGRQIGRR